MKRAVLFFGLVASLGVTACNSKSPTSGDTTSGTASSKSSSKKEPSEADLRELTVDDVDQRLAKNDGTFHVYDANNEDVFAAGHVPSAKWVPFSEVKANMLPEKKTDTLVFYCANEH
jgi:hypothetical protein